RRRGSMRAKTRVAATLIAVVNSRRAARPPPAGLVESMVCDMFGKSPAGLQRLTVLHLPPALRGASDLARAAIFHSRPVDRRRSRYVDGGAGPPPGAAGGGDGR